MLPARRRVHRLPSASDNTKGEATSVSANFHKRNSCPCWLSPAHKVSCPRRERPQRKPGQRLGQMPFQGMRQQGHSSRVGPDTRRALDTARAAPAPCP